MQGISLSPQHPLILAYYCISMIDPTEKFVKVGIIHPIVHHLKVMELFMTLTDVSWHPNVVHVYLQYSDMRAYVSMQVVMISQI